MWMSEYYGGWFAQYEGTGFSSRKTDTGVSNKIAHDIQLLYMTINWKGSDIGSKSQHTAVVNI